MLQTKNFFLKLFEGTDKFDYNVINENWEQVDNAVDQLLNGGNLIIFPTITVETVEEGYKITTKDAKQVQSFIVASPVKGKDYWTKEDKTNIINDVLTSLPNASGVNF